MSDASLTRLTTHIVAAYLEHNPTAAADIPGLIAIVHRAVSDLNGVPASVEPAVTQRRTAAQIRKSITPDALVSFEDGRLYKHLKRSLTAKGLTPAAYREKWGLPADYPMVAPNSSAARSAMSKAAGFGRRGKPVAAVPEADVPTAAPAPAPAAKPRAKLSLFGKKRAKPT